MRFFEDFSVGEVIPLGSFRLSAQAIVDFARRYDPLPFHLEDDPNNPYGGLIASGWQTGVECQKLIVKAILANSATLGSPGASVRFLRPVRAEIEYRADFAITEARRSAKRPERGLVRATLSLRDPEDQPVYLLDAELMVLTKPE